MRMTINEATVAKKTKRRGAHSKEGYAKQV